MGSVGSASGACLESVFIYSHHYHPSIIILYRTILFPQVTASGFIIHFLLHLASE